MPKDRTRCFEVSELHCNVLRAKDYDVTQADFLAWAETTTERFVRIVMNLPSSDGRWQSHTKAARRLVADKGNLTAILPASEKEKDLLPGFDYKRSSVIDNVSAGSACRWRC